MITKYIWNSKEEDEDDDEDQDEDDDEDQDEDEEEEDDDDEEWRWKKSLKPSGIFTQEKTWKCTDLFPLSGRGKSKQDTPTQNQWKFR
jgi:hypothetical protein